MEHRKRRCCTAPRLNSAQRVPTCPLWEGLRPKPQPDPGAEDEGREPPPPQSPAPRRRRAALLPRPHWPRRSPIREQRPVSRPWLVEPALGPPLAPAWPPAGRGRGRGRGRAGGGVAACGRCGAVRGGAGWGRRAAAGRRDHGAGSEAPATAAGPRTGEYGLRPAGSLSPALTPALLGFGPGGCPAGRGGRGPRSPAAK